MVYLTMEPNQLAEENTIWDVHILHTNDESDYAARHLDRQTRSHGGIYLRAIFGDAFSEFTPK